MKKNDKSLMMMKYGLMSSGVSWHIRDKLWPMPKHGSVLLYVHTEKPQGSIIRKAQDGHLDLHTAPELWQIIITKLDLQIIITKYDFAGMYVSVIAKLVIICLLLYTYYIIVILSLLATSESHIENYKRNCLFKSANSDEKATTYVHV